MNVRQPATPNFAERSSEADFGGAEDRGTVAARFRQAVAQAPDDYELLLQAAAFHFSNPTESLEAIHYLERALAIQVSFKTITAYCIALMREGYYQKALEATLTGIRRYPSRFELELFLPSVFSSLGLLQQASEASRLITSKMMLKARQLSRGKKPYLILHPISPIQTHIGEMVCRLDGFLKLQKLGLVPDFHPAVLIADDRPVCNSHMLDYFRPHIDIVQASASSIARKIASPDTCCFDLEYIYLKGHGGKRLLAAWQVANRLWAEREEPPLLKLTKADTEHGQALKKVLGIPDGAWFVALHMREGGFWNDRGSDNPSSLRNTVIDDFLPAIEEITARGGWVVRMGDPTMTPMPRMARVVDYALSPHKSAAADVILCACSRFMVGTVSGLATVPSSFGVPVLSVNAFPFLHYPGLAGDRYIHKMVRDRDGRMLSIRELFSPPILYQPSPAFFRQKGLEVMPNSADEIRLATVEMLDILDGKPADDAEADRLWRRYCEAADFEGTGMPLRVGAAFLRRWQALF